MSRSARLHYTCMHIHILSVDHPQRYYVIDVREFCSSTGEAPNRLNKGIPSLAGQIAGSVLASGASS